MPDGDVERKKIADLYFNIDTTNLDKVNTILDNIDTKVTQMNKRNLSIKFDIDTSSLNFMNANVNKAFSNIESSSKNTTGNLQQDLKNLKDDYSKKMQDMVSDNENANNQIQANGKSVNTHLENAAIDLAKVQERENIKTTAMIERENAKQLSSHKSVYEQINNYAKTYLVYQGFDYLKRGASELIEEMVQVEYQMNSIDRVLGDSSLNINNYRDQLIQLASDYGNTFDNVADITLRLAQAGFDAQQSLALTEKTLLALNTAELDATQATDDMVAIMSQWNLMTGDSTQVASDYGNIIDKINKVADQFPTSSADILDALKKTSSAFNIAGASIDETIAMITTAEIASQRGGKAIGTAMSNIIQQLKDEGRLNTMEDLGIDVYTDKTKEEFNSVIDIITQLSEKMQELKAAGKENSVEMQDLLTVFTVFRRNIGAGLLSGVAGEESTYNDVLTTSLNAYGYSLQENSKYMQTAKAAQAQFNAELLKLKTEVWDGGLEDVFRGLLEMGTNFVEGIRNIVDEVGVLPTAIGTATLAFSMLNKSTQASNYIGAISSIRQINQLYKDVSNRVVDVSDYQKKYNEIIANSSPSFQQYSKDVARGTQAVGGYAKSLVKATTQTVLMTAKTVILQAAISAGLTLAITALVSAIDNFVNADEKAREALQEDMETAQNNATEIENEISNIQKLRKEYEELAKKEERTPEDNQKIYEIQEQINQLLKDTGTQVELITTKTNKQGEAVQKLNDKYDEQLEKIKAVEYQKKRDDVNELKGAAQSAEQLKTPYTQNVFDFGEDWDMIDISNELKDAHIDFTKYATQLQSYQTSEKEFIDKLVAEGEFDFESFLHQANFDEQLTVLTEVKTQLERTGNTGGKAYSKISEIVNDLNSKQETVTNAINKYKDALGELYSMSGQFDSYETFLNSISESYGDLEGPQKLIDELHEVNNNFSEGELTIEEYFNTLQEKIDSIDLSAQGEELEAYRAIFAATTSSIAEGVESLYGGLTSGAIDFTDYVEGIEEAGEASLDLYTKQKDLEQVNGIWQDATGAVDDYANGLQESLDALDDYDKLLGVIGEHYDYIAKNANAAGEAAFTSADTSSKAYKSLANDLTTTLNTMKDTNEETYNSITQTIADNIGISTNQMMDAHDYLSNGFLMNEGNMNTSLNTIATMTQEVTRNVTISMGNVLNKLGAAISNFKYSINAKPYIEGGIGLRTDDKGRPTGLDLPSFGFDITGKGGESVQELGAALQQFGTDVAKYGQVTFAYSQLQQQAPYSPRDTTTDSPSSPRSPASTGSGGSSSSRQDDEDRKEEERYQKKLDKYKNYIDDLEEEEQRWVDRQQELGQLSSEDMQYVTQQRIKRYQKYLNQVKKMTWLNKEDRLELEKEYTQQIEDLQLEYMGYLKDALDEEIDAIQEANEKKIEAIEEEADKQIEALQKVEDERDRIRDKEDYENQRKEIEEEIAYWEQRTGREAQENLKEAKESLEELDEEWEDQLEDWSIEDQIAKIEEQRDAQIAAIEEAEEKEIAALQKIYDQKVKLFSETGKIIYDNGVIQSKKLYSAYKKNFVNPITSDLNKLYKSTSSKSSSSSKKYESYKIKYGDTLSGIAAKFDTTVSKIMDANPSIKNKNLIYAGSTLKIPKFHEGGIVGGTQEAFALLKPNEVILKTEWAASLNRMMKYFDNLTTGNLTNITNGPTIKVSGNLVNIEANIKNKSDINYLERRIEKMLNDKFNIKK